MEDEPELLPFAEVYWEAFELLSETRTKTSTFGGIALNPLQPTEMVTVGHLMRIYPTLEFVRIMRRLDDKYLALVHGALKTSPGAARGNASKTPPRS